MEHFTLSNLPLEWKYLIFDHCDNKTLYIIKQLNKEFHVIIPEYIFQLKDNKYLRLSVDIKNEITGLKIHCASFIYYINEYGHHKTITVDSSRYVLNKIRKYINERNIIGRQIPYNIFCDSYSQREFKAFINSRSRTNDYKPTICCNLNISRLKQIFTLRFIKN